MVSREEISEKISRYMEEKHNLDLNSCYWVCKGLVREYEDRILNGDTPEPEAYNFDDIDMPIQHPTMNTAIAQQQANPVLPNIRQPDLPIQVI